MAERLARICWSSAMSGKSGAFDWEPAEDAERKVLNSIETLKLSPQYRGLKYWLEYQDEAA